MKKEEAEDTATMVSKYLFRISSYISWVVCNRLSLALGPGKDGKVR